MSVIQVLHNLFHDANVRINFEYCKCMANILTTINNKTSNANDFDSIRITIKPIAKAVVVAPADGIVHRLDVLSKRENVFANVADAAVNRFACRLVRKPDTFSHNYTLSFFKLLNVVQVYFLYFHVAQLAFVAATLQFLHQFAGREISQTQIPCVYSINRLLL